MDGAKEHTFADVKDEYATALRAVEAGTGDEDELFKGVRDCLVVAQQKVAKAESAEQAAAETDAAQATAEAAAKTKGELAEILQMGTDASNRELCKFLVGYGSKHKAKQRRVAEVVVILFTEPSLKQIALEDVEQKKDLFSYLIRSSVRGKTDHLKDSIENLFQDDPDFKSLLAGPEKGEVSRKPSEGPKPGGYPGGKPPSENPKAGVSVGTAVSVGTGDKEVTDESANNEQRQFQWMWADTKGLGLSKRLARLDILGLHWSSPFLPVPLGDDIAKHDDEKSAILIKPAEGGDHMKFANPSAVYEWIEMGCPDTVDGAYSV